MDGKTLPLRGAWALTADGRLFGAEQKTRMLAALLAVGFLLSLPVLAAAIARDLPAVVALEAALAAGKLACAAWVMRARDLSNPASMAIVTYNTVCATASNVLYPGDVRPLSAQLLLAVLFVSWFLPGALRTAQLGLLAVACAVTLIGANPLDAEVLRVVTLLLTGATVAVLASALRDRHRQLDAQATTDILTGVGNRRAYEREVESALSHAQRSGEPLSLVLMDLDDFKELNDTRGHPAGDAELSAVARLLLRRARRQDSVFRLGGDEFAVLLRGTPAEGAVRFSDSITDGEGRRRIGLRTSMTAGVAEYPEHAQSADSLIRAADAALLGAKRAGKARVSVAVPGPA